MQQLKQHIASQNKKTQNFDISKYFIESFMCEAIKQTAEKRKAEIHFDRDRILEKLRDFRNKGEGDELSDDEYEEKNTFAVKKKDSFLNLSKTNEPVFERVTKEQELKNQNLIHTSLQIGRGIRSKPAFKSFSMPRTMPKKYAANFMGNIPLSRTGSNTKPAPAISEKIIVFSMGKINPLISDRDIQMIECPGAGKQILIYKSGVIQNTNIVLDKGEINLLMKEFSKKTKIPLISGVFKAALDNFIITAVISDFIGTRFILQKKDFS